MRVLSLFLLNSLLLACGPDPGGEVPRAPLAGGKADSLAPLDPGSYTLQLISITRFRDKDTAEEWDMTTRVTALATTIALGDEPGLTLQPCRVMLPKVGDYQPRVPNDTVAGMAAETVLLQPAEGNEPGFVTSAARFTLGLDPEHTDAMPADPDDPALWDQDGDGLPGVSVNVLLFRVYLALRMTVVLRGQGLEGTAEMELEQSILGDDIPFYDAAESAAEAQAQSELVGAINSFELAPTEAASCNELD